MRGEPYDFVAVGGGAAGFFGAIAFAEAAPGSRVAVLEKSGEFLQKVRISGGGRCNVTHDLHDPRELVDRYPRGRKSLIGPFHRWMVGDTIDWFAQRGVELKTEEDGRMFPVTDDSATVVACLVEAAQQAGVEMRDHCPVESLRRVEGGWELDCGRAGLVRSRSVLLATGGIRNGAGTQLAGLLGHEIVSAAPSLFTFRISDPRIEDLAGVSVPEVVTEIPALGLRSDGPLLITHWGMSGPAILKLSAFGARELADRDYRFEAVIRWLGGRREQEVEDLLTQARERSPKRFVRSPVDGIDLPARLWQRLVEAAGIGEETTWANLTKAERSALVQQLAGGSFSVDGKSMNKDEFVTAGGIALGEVDLRRMESRLHPGLFFAGEVLDVDGVTGGFNFQAAWTTAKIAGEAAAERVGLCEG